MNLLNRCRHTARLIAFAVAMTACGQQTPEQHFQQAQGLVNKADYGAAVIELKNVLQAQPDNRAARLLLGEVFVRQGAYHDAETELSKASELGASDAEVFPALAKVYLMTGKAQRVLGLGIPSAGLSYASLAALLITRAEAQIQLGQRAEAEQSLTLAEQIAPAQPGLRLAQAKLALLDKRPERAGQWIDEALKQDPKFLDALYFKAGLLQSLEKWDEAIAVYEQIVANDPSQVFAHVAVARLQLKKGDLEAADKAVKAAEAAAGKKAIVMYTRGSLELQRGNLEAASAAFGKVLAIVPDDPSSLLAHAVANHGLGNFEQSINKTRKLLASDPGNLLATRILASSQLQSGDAKGAWATLEPVLVKHPDNVDLIALAGEVHLALRDYNKAIALLNKAVELDPANTTIRTRQAVGHFAAGDSQQALADLEQAVRLSNRFGQADLMLVTVRLKRKEYDQALEEISRLEKKLSNNPLTNDLRATALLGKGDRVGARKALEQALVTAPKYFPAVLGLGRLDVQEGQLTVARQRFEAIVASDNNNIEALLALAELAAFEKRENDYVDWLDKAVRADPKQMKARSALVRHYLDKKESQKALALALDANAANPDNPQAMNLLGTTQLALGDSQAAVETYLGMVRKAPQSADALLALALAQMAAQQASAARATLKQVLQLQPDLLQAVDALFQLEVHEQNYGAALKIARQMQSQQPGSPLGFDREADLLLAQKRYAEAAKRYEQALEKGKGASTSGLLKLHRALRLAGDEKVAEQKLNEWIQQYPRDLALRAQAAEVAMQARRDREAIAHYQDLLKLSPNNVVALGNLANLYLHEKDGRAVATAEQALRLAPDDPRVFDILGWILVENGQIARGLDLLSKAAAQLPDIMSVRYHHGAALARSGKKAEAKKELETVLAAEQSSPELKRQARKVVESL